MYVDELAGKGLDFKILAELLYQFALSFVPTALPLAILLAALMTFGNMGEFSELTALKSSGISLQRIMRPLIVLIGFLCIVSLRRKRPDINLQAGTFNNDIDGFSIKVTSKDPITNRLDKLIIYDHRERRGNISVITADSGYIKVTPDETEMIMILYNGVSFTELQEKNVGPQERRYPTRKDVFKEQSYVLSLSGFDLERSEIDMFKSNSWMLNLEQLTYFIDSLTTRFNKQQNNQFKEFNGSKLYLQRNFPSGTDTGEVAKEIVTFDANKLFDSISVYEKRSVMATVIENLKDISNYLTTKNEATKYDIRRLKRYEVDWNKKLTLPFACLVFFFIGAPLGSIIRKGGLGTPAVISIFFFVIWYVISLSGEKLVEENLVSTFAGMWAASYILLPIGVFLTYKASTDSVILNIDTYLAFFRKIKDYMYRVYMTGTGKRQVK
jgi:lipopolysaccharide export system permease protein